MKYNGIIEAKLRIIEEKLLEIESWQITSYQQLQTNSMLRNATERALQVTVEAILDVCEHILATGRHFSPRYIGKCGKKSN